MSESHSIISQQAEQRKQQLRQREREQAETRERQEWIKAWDAVRLSIEPDGATPDPARAVRAIANLRGALANRSLLEQLGEPPVRVQGEELQAWTFARYILDRAANDRKEAGRLLADINGLGFAPTVRNWLTDGFRIVAENKWETGPLAVEMIRPINAIPKPKEAPNGSGPAGQGKASKPRMKVAQANEKGKELVRQLGKILFTKLSERNQAKRIGCSWKTWTKTELYKQYRKMKERTNRKSAKGKRASSPPVVSLTDKLEDAIGEGEKDSVLKKLIADQEADAGSDPNQPGRKSYSPKRRL
jgi:hypothetical protein